MRREPLRPPSDPRLRNSLAGRGGPPPASSPKPSPRRRMTRGLVALGSAAILSVYAIGYAKTQAAENLILAQASGLPNTGAPPTVPSPTVLAMLPGGAANATPGAATPAVTPDAASPTTAPAADTPAANTPITAAVVPTATNVPATAPSVPPTATHRAAATAKPTARPVVPTPVVVPPTATARPTPRPVPTATATPAGKYRDGTYTGTGYSRHGDVVAQVVVQGGKIVSANITACYTHYPCSDIAPMLPEVVQLQGPPVDLVSGATDTSMAYQGAVASALAKAGA
jgi:uncharacterized protein with FMN-binding domain